MLRFSVINPVYSSKFRSLLLIPFLLALVLTPQISAAQTTSDPPSDTPTAQNEAKDTEKPVTPPAKKEVLAEMVEGTIVETKKNDDTAKETAPKNWRAEFDYYFSKILVEPLEDFLFFDFGSKRYLNVKIPFVVVWLLFGALFFTLRMGFINFRGFWHAIQVTRGKFDKPGEEGEVSHFQALASALSATVGLGNIAGVAIAVGTGGPGAIFWLILAGLFGMSSKFVECTLGQMYRKVEPDGTVTGGAMQYLKEGLGELGFPRIGVFLSVIFALLCMGASFGGGCVFQVSQSLNAIKHQSDFFKDYPWVYGVILAFFAGIVIIGGIRRIAATAEKIVPLMCGIYVAAALYILYQHYNDIPSAFKLIFTEAFSIEAGIGGFLGTMVIGIKRAAFSNEAGIGSAPIAHAAAKTDEPISEGIVALLEPFIDTVVVCTMTGLVIVITGVRGTADGQKFIDADNGAGLTSMAFGSVIDWFPYILMVATVLFAYSTMISWSYYGERCCRNLFGPRASIIYKCIFILFIVIGSIATSSSLLAFSDVLLLSMAFPNICGCIFLSGKVKRHLNHYWQRYKSGELDPEKT
ncbi:MAG: alanine/glycine:cation symporter family protein [Planctomycetia bacterium]|jgi:AGCS family alanine or glycine:cation symporter